MANCWINRFLDSLQDGIERRSTCTVQQVMQVLFVFHDCCVIQLAPALKCILHSNEYSVHFALSNLGFTKWTFIGILLKLLQTFSIYNGKTITCSVMLLRLNPSANVALRVGSPWNDPISKWRIMEGGNTFMHNEVTIFFLPFFKISNLYLTSVLNNLN